MISGKGVHMYKCEEVRFTDTISFFLRYFSRISPILQVFANNIPDKLAVSFNSSSSLLSSYKWFLTIGSKYCFVKAYNVEISFILRIFLHFYKIPNPSSACIF